MVPARSITLSLVSPVPVYFNVPAIVVAPRWMVPFVPMLLLAPARPTLATLSVPAATVVAPAYVFVALRISVPVPFLLMWRASHLGRAVADYAGQFRRIATAAIGDDPAVTVTVRTGLATPAGFKSIGSTNSVFAFELTEPNLSGPRILLPKSGLPVVSMLSPQRAAHRRRRYQQSIDFRWPRSRHRRYSKPCCYQSYRRAGE